MVPAKMVDQEAEVVLRGVEQHGLEVQAPKEIRVPTLGLGMEIPEVQVTGEAVTMLLVVVVPGVAGHLVMARKLDMMEYKIYIELAQTFITAEAGEAERGAVALGMAVKEAVALDILEMAVMPPREPRTPEVGEEAKAVKVVITEEQVALEL